MTINIDINEFRVVNLWQLLVDMQLCESKSAAKRAIESGAVKVWNGESWELIEMISTRETIVKNLKTGIIRCGKRKVKQIIF